ncbi:hypothetical protein J3E68DRAFT_448661 [Trichoderma sp. SZMC 28012]
MYRHLLRENLEEFIVSRPGAPEEEEQLRNWIEGRDEPLSLQHVLEWMDNIGVFRNQHEENSYVKYVVDKFATNFQKEISPTATIRLPGYGYPLDKMPLNGYSCFPVIATSEGISWTTKPLFIKELCILKAVEEITNKPGWWDHVRDTRITEGWKKEMLALEWSDYLNHATFTLPMAEWCIEELKDKADLYEKTGLIPILDSKAGVIKSDKLVPDDLKRELSIASKKLLQTLDENDISHNGISFHLIDPSIYPLIYDRSRILPDRTINRTNCLEACGKGDILQSIWGPNEKDRPSGIFDCFSQWLPCDVIVDETGHAKVDSYINNLHPVHHADMYTTIEKFITLALPAWDIIYRAPQNFRHQRISNNGINYDCTVPDICADRECSWSNMPTAELKNYLKRKEFQSEEFEKKQQLATSDLKPMVFTPPKCDEGHLLNLKLERDEDLVDRHLRKWANEEGHEWIGDITKCRVDCREDPIYNWFNETHPFQIPEPPRFYSNPNCPKSSDVRSHDFFGFRHSRNPIQVIVELTEIRLTPENPEYYGDLWNVDGRFNEHIVSTAMFCYDSDNVTANHLYFDVAPREDSTWDQPLLNSNDAMRLFAIKSGGKDSQVLGRTLVDPGWAVFYPNVYRHRQGSFSLVDRSRPGYRKVLKLCLVEPSLPIISTSNVPPQQWDWWTECKAHNEGLNIAGRLPPELRYIVFNDVDFPITNGEAKIIRQMLKARRGSFELFTTDLQVESEDESQGYEGMDGEDQDDEDQDDEDQDDESQDERSDFEEPNSE